ncbi:MAG: TonB-dependent receptor, partial [Bacteroidaceae bacterium]|nr:TonB-dependent receptor [Bacteroidaceae bacterium]
MAALSYQYAPGGSDNTEFEYELGDNDKVVLKEAQVRQYYVTRQRQSYSLSMDYKFNADHKISFKGLYNLRHDWENRYRISYKKLSSKASKQSVVLQTKAGEDGNKSARLEEQQTMDFTLDGEHSFGNLKLDWATSYARATEDRPNERYMALKLTGTDWVSSFVDAGDKQPYSTLTIPAFTEKGWKIDELTNSDQKIKENEYKLRLNFELPISHGLYGNKLKFGGKFVSKQKQKDIAYFEYDDDVVADWQNNLTTKVRSGFMPGSQYPIGTLFVDKYYLGKIDFSQYKGTEVLEEEAGNFKARENITSAYIRFDQKLGKRLDATLGLRLESTNLKTSGVNYMMDAEDKETLVPTGDYKNSYSNLLPSLLLKYKL